MAVTTTDLRARLEQDGYVVVPSGLPRANLEAVSADIWQHTGADPHDRESWYKPGIVAATGMVELYHTQAMWDNRQDPGIHEIFTDVYGTPQLWVSLDRVNLKPPADPRHPEHDHKGFIHWDTDTARYPAIPFRVQAVLALADTDASQGGFQCVPALYRDLARWIAGQPADRNPRKPDLTGYTITKVPLRAGDLVIWSTLMPHGNGHNISDRPRLAQYLTMAPAQEDNAEARQTRIRCWERNLPPPGPAFPGDPRQIEQRRGQPAALAALGRKLLGLDSWE